MGLSTIQWCRYSFNAWLGCRQVAPECINCYITTTPTFKFRGLTHGPVRIRTVESTWRQPLAWNRKAAKEGVRERVFSLSLGDWLDDENVPIEWFADLLKLIHDTPNLDWLLLTKRPQNWRNRMINAMDWIDGNGPKEPGGVPDVYSGPMAATALMIEQWTCDKRAPSNVWIGVSAGADQAAALDIPARVHFLSCEPMLRPLDTTHAARFDWIIFGGESGSKARPLNVDWILDGVVFCEKNDVACFVKQLGSKPFQNVESPMCDLHPLKDSHGGDMDEWPEDLRVREFPTAATPKPNQ